MKLDVELDLHELKGELARYSKDFGETSQQALIRLAAHTAKQCATLTEPKGNQKRQKDLIMDRIEAGAAKCVIVIGKKTFFNRLKKMKNPYLMIGVKAKRMKLHPGQICEDFGELWAHVEKFRAAGRKGHPRYCGDYQKKIIPEALWKKLRVERRKLAGIAKGSWLGAGLAAQGMVKWNGSNRPIGKNYMNWTQKWAKRGAAYRIPGMDGNDTVVLRSNAHHIGNLIGTREFDQAWDTGWRDVLKWYRIAVGKLDEGRRAA